MLGGVIYLHDISQDRFSGTARQHLETFNRYRRDAALNKVVLATTKWSRLSESDGSRREAELKEVPWKSMRDKGAEVLRFLGDQKSAWDIVSVFLDRASESERLEKPLKDIRAEISGKRPIIPKQKLAPPKINSRVANDEILEDGKETDIVILFVIPLLLSTRIMLIPIPELWAQQVLEKARYLEISLPLGVLVTHKSKFINFLLGEERTRVGHATTSCTANLQPVVFDPGDRFPSLKNYRVVIVDTPGFDDTFVGDVEILRRIADWLTVS